MYRDNIINIIVDDLISKAMTYNETLHSNHKLSEFDFAAEQLCKSRRKIIRYLRRL